MFGLFKKKKPAAESSFQSGKRSLEEYDYQRAATLLGEAWSQESENPKVGYAFGYALYHDGRFDEAEAVFSELLEKFPEHESGRVGMALASLNRRDLDEAERYIDSALEVRPTHVEAWLVHARVMILQSKMQEALESLDTVLRLDKNNPEAFIELGYVELYRKHIAEAKKYCVKALELAPDNPRALMLSSTCEFFSGDANTSLQLIEQALTIAPRLVGALNHKGRILMRLGEMDSALESYQQSLAISQTRDSTYYFIGLLHSQMNAMDEARQSFQNAIAINKAHGLSHLNLAKISKYTSENTHMQEMEEQLRVLGDAMWLPRMQLSFALAKAYEDLGEYDKAFAHMEQGNKLCWENSIRYDYESTAASYSRIQQLYTKELVDELSEYGAKSRSPIFIVGMPRSGSTLIDHILAAHPQMESLGETQAWSRAVQSTIAESGPQESDEALVEYLAQHAGQAYMDELHGLTNSPAESLINKALINFVEIGLISCCLPRARIIHSKRHPLDICISCYKNLLEVGNQPYIYNLQELGRYYLLYDKMMRHWERILPGRIIHVQYETLVAEPEKEVRVLLDALGEEFDPACMEFYKNRRQVQTASLAQVRQPMYTSSVASWKRYEKHLEPLIAILGEQVREPVM